MESNEKSGTLLDRIAKSAKALGDMDFEAGYRVRRQGVFGYPRKGFKDPRMGWFGKCPDEWFPTKYIKLLREQEENVKELQEESRKQASQD